MRFSYRDPHLTQIRPGQIRVTDSCSAFNSLILNSSERRHLRRKVVDLASEFSSVNRRVVGSSPPEEPLFYLVYAGSTFRFPSKPSKTPEDFCEAFLENFASNPSSAPPLPSFPNGLGEVVPLFPSVFPSSTGAMTAASSAALGA